MSSLKFITSEKGKELIVLDGFKYRYHKELLGGIQRWTCSIGRSNKCSAYLKTEGKRNIIEASHNHNHPPIDEKILKRNEISNSLKRKASDDLNEKPMKLIQQELRKGDVETLTNCDINRIRKNIYQARRDVLSKLPKDQAAHPKLGKKQNSLDVEMSSLKFITSEKGKELIVLNGFKYRYHKELSGGIQRWTCSIGKSNKCLAYLKTKGKRNIIEASYNHSHPPVDEKILKRNEISNSLKSKASDDLNERPMELIQRELRKGDVETLTTCDIKRIRKNISQARRNVLSKLPKDQAAEVHHALKTHPKLGKKQKSLDVDFVSDSDNLGGEIYSILVLQQHIRTMIRELGNF